MATEITAAGRAGVVNVHAFVDATRNLKLRRRLVNSGDVRRVFKLVIARNIHRVIGNLEIHTRVSSVFLFKVMKLHLCRRELS